MPQAKNNQWDYNCKKDFLSSRYEDASSSASARGKFKSQI